MSLFICTGTAKSYWLARPRCVRGVGKASCLAQQYWSRRIVRVSLELSHPLIPDGLSWPLMAAKQSCSPLLPASCCPWFLSNSGLYLQRPSWLHSSYPSCEGFFQSRSVLSDKERVRLNLPQQQLAAEHFVTWWISPPTQCNNTFVNQ